MRIRVFLLSAALVLCGRAPARGALLPDGAFSDDARGLTSASFLKTPPSARFESLSGACLVQSGPQALFCNPAGLANSERGSAAAALAYESLLEGSYRAGSSFSLGSARGAFSAGVIYNDSSSGLYKYDSLGDCQGKLSAYDSSAGGAFALRGSLVDFGLGVKYIKSKLGEAAGSSAAMDVGFIFKNPVDKTANFGLVFRNFGFPLKLGSESAPLPFEFGAGMKLRYTPEFDILLEARMPADHAPYVIGAGEWFLPFSPSKPGSAAWSLLRESGPGFFFRGGMNFKNHSDLGAFGAFAGGFGLRLGAFELNYAFVPYGELGATHRTEIAWRFPGIKKTQAAPEKAPVKYVRVVMAPFKNGQGVTQTQAEVLRNLLEAELSLAGGVKLVERQKLDFIMSEKKLVQAGLSQENSSRELGRLSGAEAAVFGFVSKDGGRYLLTARLVDVSSGAIVRSTSADADDEYFFRQAARKMAAALLP